MINTAFAHPNLGETTKHTHTHQSFDQNDLYVMNFEVKVHSWMRFIGNSWQGDSIHCLMMILLPDFSRSKFTTTKRHQTPAVSVICGLLPWAHMTWTLIRWSCLEPHISHRRLGLWNSYSLMELNICTRRTRIAWFVDCVHPAADFWIFFIRFFWFIGCKFGSQVSREHSAKINVSQ